jgi:dihydrolipoamide dehydrogenase
MRLPLVSRAQTLRRQCRANACVEEKDLIIIGGGVAGYVAAIKAGQEGLKVRASYRLPSTNHGF